ncbi:MAG: hypothetical protein JOZ11_14980 [Alphaproteobacteria bacterium]|nr:hypothetical protein [Alphaproteobacteria bacterium]
MRICATPALGRSRYGLSLPLIFGLGVYALIAGHGGAVLHDPDTYLHIGVGRWIIEHRALPHHGIFSGTMAQAPWVAHEWLGEVLLAWMFDTFGWAGLVAVTAFCVAVAMAMLLRQLLRSLVPVHAMIATSLAVILAIPHVLARPHVFTLPILVAWVAGLVTARSEARTPAAWLVALMALWANLHGGYLFGLALTGLLATEAVLLAPDWRTRRRAAGGWAFFGALAVGAALLTPYGVAGLLLPFRLAEMSFAMGQLVEWRSPDFQSFEPLELWLAVVLFAGFALGWRLPLTRLFMLLLLLHMALQHRRHGELVGLVAPLLLAPALASQLRALTAGRSAGPVDRSLAELAKPASLRGVALAGAALAALSAAMLHGAATRTDVAVPTAALAAVEAAHVTGPVLNDYGFGGYLIFAGIPPFIDGRAELYGDEFIRRYVQAMLLESDELPKLLDQYGIVWTLIAPERPAALLLDHLPGWLRLYADDDAVVHVRTGPAPSDRAG